MFLPPTFTSSNNINSNALVTSTGVNVIKSNFDTFLSAVGSLYISQLTGTININLNSNSLINTFDCSLSNATVTLPSLSTASSNGLKTYSFKKIDNSNNYITISAAASDTLENFATHAGTPITTSITLKLIDEEVILMPTANGWRIISHYFPSSLLSCSVGLSASQTINSGTVSTIQFNNKTGQFFDPRSLYNTSGFFYNCFVSGYYLVTGILSIQGSGSNSHQWIKLYKDTGSGFSDIATLAEFDIGTGLTRYNFSYYLKLNENDRIQLQTANDNTTKTLLGGSNTLFSVQFMSY